MRTQTVKVNRSITYIRANRKLVPAIVTAVTNQTTVNLRVGRQAGNTFAAVAKQTADAQVGVWRFTDAFQNV